MINKKEIKTGEDLQAEIDRLKLLSANQKQELTSGLNQLKARLSPENLISSAIHAIKDRFFSSAVNNGIGFIFRRIFIRKEKRITDLIFSFIDSMFSKNKKSGERSSD